MKAALLALAVAASPAAQELAQGPWEPVAADGVAVELRHTASCPLQLVFDFHGIAGWAGARTLLAKALPENFQLALTLAGSVPKNRLELKFVAGENVFWHTLAGFSLEGERRQLTVPKRKFRYAWGPRPDASLTEAQAFELVLAAEKGGRGEVCLEKLDLTPLPSSPPGKPSAFLNPPGDGAAAATLDGDPESFWQAGSSVGELRWELGEEKELFGLALAWGPHRPKTVQLAVRCGEAWRTLVSGPPPAGPVAVWSFPATCADAVLAKLEGNADERPSVAEVVFGENPEGPDPSWAYTALARLSPRGFFPRSLRGEQVYWGITGFPEGAKVLVSEDGIVELGDPPITVEPMLQLGGRLVSWADATVVRRLPPEGLPLPEVSWQLPPFSLTLLPRVVREDGADFLVLQAQLANHGRQAVAGSFTWVLRPLRVTPPWATLNLPSPMGHLESVELSRGVLWLNGQLPVGGFPQLTWRGTRLEQGEVVFGLLAGEPLSPLPVNDPAGLASAAGTVSCSLPPGGSQLFRLVFGLSGKASPQRLLQLAKDPEQPMARAATAWEHRLARFSWQLPEQAQRLSAAARANLGYLLLHREGAALQPGSRQYARIWIRDAAGMGIALLRAGFFAEVREFLLTFARYQFADGKVPCCVDRRGADPVPEHDAAGEFVFLARAYGQYTKNWGTVRKLWPHLEAAGRYILRLRQQRLGEGFRGQLFFGLLPPSISHEGYSAHPVHSYWDDFWALAGLRALAELAEALGESAQASFWQREQELFAADLLRSLQLAMESRGLDYVPGSADLGDFDPSATAVALDPLELWLGFPLPWERTFLEYLEKCQARASERRTYSPYEVRIAGSLLRLGHPQEALHLLEQLLEDTRPSGWYGWPEVVTANPREPRFVGDMPHGWIAGDFLRAFLDLFAYPQGQTLVVGAGVPEAWLAPGARLSTPTLRTPWGSFSLKARGERRQVVCRISGDTPPGGVRLTMAAGKRVRINGKPQPPSPEGVLVRRLPATVSWSR